MRRRSYPQRRRYRRLTVRVQVEYSSSAGLHSELATTLGAGGLFVSTDSPLPMRTRLKLRFRLPGTDDVWEVEGRVAWSNPTGMGVEFVDRGQIVRLAQALETWTPPA